MTNSALISVIYCTKCVLIGLWLKYSLQTCEAIGRAAQDGSLPLDWSQSQWGLQFRQGSRRFSWRLLLLASFPEAEILTGAFLSFHRFITNLIGHSLRRVCDPGDHGQNMLMGKPFACFCFGLQGRFRTVGVETWSLVQVHVYLYLYLLSWATWTLHFGL